MSAINNNLYNDNMLWFDLRNDLLLPTVDPKASMHIFISLHYSTLHWTLYMSPDQVEHMDECIIHMYSAIHHTAENDTYIFESVFTKCRNKILRCYAFWPTDSIHIPFKRRSRDTESFVHWLNTYSAICLTEEARKWCTNQRLTSVWPLTFLYTSPAICHLFMLRC